MNFSRPPSESLANDTSDNSLFSQRVGSGTHFFSFIVWASESVEGVLAGRHGRETFVVFAKVFTALDMPSWIFTFSWFRLSAVLYYLLKRGRCVDVMIT